MPVTSPLLPALGGYWNGTFHTTGSAADVRVHDPSDGSLLATLPGMGEAEARAAVASAEAAPTLSLAQRVDVLGQIAAALTANRDELARIVTLENGKPLAESLGEVDYAAAFYADARRHVPRLAPRELAERPRGLRWIVHARPAGVAGLITPWNFPLAMLAKKLSGAIAAGCPSVVKPAEKTPLSCIAFFTLLDGLDLPAGLVSMVFGDAPAIGNVLCTHPAVRVVSFTGSTAVGKLLSAACAPHVKRLSLELGGNAPFVVFADADLVAAADALIANKFRCSGQTCVCTNRVYVQEGVYDRFCAEVEARVARLVVGAGMAPGTQVGPLIDTAGVTKVDRLVTDAVAHGARVVLGGTRSGGAGTFYPPTVLADVTPEMACTREEAFGPLVPLARFADEAEAITACNATEYGLAAYVFTGDLDRATRVAAALHFGHVGLNTGAGPTAEAPFGGMKQSGIGREGGEEGVFEYVEWQTTPMPV